jgi:hypothetical protein
MVEFLITQVIPRCFVADVDGFLDLRVDVAAVSRRTGRKLIGKSISYEKLASWVSEALTSRLKLGCTLSDGILAGQGSTFLFTATEAETLGLIPLS